MSMKADWYVLPGESVAASGTVIWAGHPSTNSEIRVLQNRIILANNESSDVFVYNMKNITCVELYWHNGEWVIEWRYSSNGSCRVYIGTNWDWANTLYYNIQCRL
jgi:hypothetical protein